MKNKFRDMMERNGITLKMLYEIMPRTSRGTLSQLWHAANNRQAANIYFDAVANFGEWKKKDWDMEL